MKKITNEQGYALITVLLIIVIFMMLAFSFMGQAANSIKQNGVIEENSQSVALAEMGVIYFEHAVRALNTSVINEIKNYDENDENDEENCKLYQEQYEKLAICKMTNALNSITLSKSIEGKTDSLFSINSLVDDDDNVLKIIIFSTGKEKDKETTIKATLTIDYTQLILKEDEDNSENPVEEIIIGKIIPDPGDLSTCSKYREEFTNIICQVDGDANYGNQLEFEDSTFKVTGNLTVGNMNNEDINNSTLFIKGNMNAGNMNKLNNVNLHVGGAGTFGNFNGGGLIDSTIEIVGNATIGTMDLKNSKIFIRSKTVMGNINSMEDSIIYIDSDATIGGVNLNHESTICVNGQLTIGHINDHSNNTSKIYAKSTIPANKQGVITSLTAFDNSCGRNTDEGLPIIWGDAPVTTEEYEYQ
ncbi:hypothetical protein EKG37_19225 [Robertmurraya yapensis]|uniref:Uncharacterized protein n=1 Tax=Bacillus yapensis TaxID=2492960 RepID=A0A431VVZ5_9BACI|nr:hypothetical protein [Bacillus yapensis]RTR27330.1 hypothetical protein EKG37_19225 [Bacillus yapensis]TKS94050.1 hypothetical protein FAR12_19230 [Bacillus yapensis]